MEIDPEFFHWLQHYVAEEKGHCKVCKKKHSKLYHCSACMTGLYCGVACQASDIGHPCLIKAHENDEDTPPAKRARYEEPPMDIISNLPVGVWNMIVNYLGKGDVTSAKQLSRYIRQRTGGAWVQGLPIRVTLRMGQMMRDVIPPESFFYVTNLEISAEAPWFIMLEELPPNLTHLTFGDGFDQPIDNAVWPRNLTHLNLGDNFDQPINNVVWPPNLTHLTFGRYFSQPINNVAWPPNLSVLTFGRYFNQPINNVIWPPGLTKLMFMGHFNQPIDNVVWPPNLTHLLFGLQFDQPIDRVRWPPNLTHLTFSVEFDQPIENVTWPPRLSHLTFGALFNQPIENVTWPPRLADLTFGLLFNQPIENVTWPASLTNLTFSRHFNRPIVGIPPNVGVSRI